MVGDRPELCALDFHLFWDLENALYENLVRTSSLPIGDARRYDDGNPTQLADAMVRTWADHLLEWRIVEDISRYPLAIDQIMEHKGGVVPDHLAQVGGCSRHVRKDTTAQAHIASRVYRPSAAVGIARGVGS